MHSAPRFQLGFVAVFLSAFFAATTSYGATTGIVVPKYVQDSATRDFKDVRPQAEDLVVKDKVLRPEEVYQLIKSGKDVSQIDPFATDVWTNQSLPISSVSEAAFPRAGVAVDYVSALTLPERLPGMYRAAVQFTAGPADVRSYNLLISLDVHAVLLRAALLRKLGYPVETPKWYAELPLNFRTAAEKETFMLLVRDRTVTEKKRWVVRETDTQLVLRDVVLEKGRVLVPQYHWGIIDPGTIQGRRALRALVVPLALADAGESINKFTWEAGKVFNKKVSLSQTYADFFSETAFEDGRWVARKIAKFTKDDWRAIANEGKFPSDVAQLVVEKLMARRNNLNDLFSLKRATPDLAVNLKLDVGAVKDGKVTREFYEGYAIRFAHGDVDSPLRFSELLRFGKIEVLGQVLQKGLDYINKHLPRLPIEDVFRDHDEEMFEKFIKHLQEHGPDEPFDVPLAVWGGPYAGFSVNANRDVVSGTYYGVDSKVQLVDSIGMRTSMGLFLALDGVDRIAPSGMAEAALQRTFLHVRPVASLQAADKASWKNLLVPKFMKDLVKGFKSDASPEDMVKELDHFLSELKENEIFTIVDSLGVGLAAEVNIPVLQLIGLDPGVASHVGIGSGLSHLLLSRTTIRRTADGFQVYVQDVVTNDWERHISVNFWTDIFRLGKTNRLGKANSKMYDVKVDDLDQAGKVKAALALRTLMTAHSAEVMNEDFKGYELDHEAKDKITRVSLLFKKWDKLEESHLVKVRPPVKEGENPADFERTLASHRIVRRSGNNFYDFLSDIINEFAQGWGPGSSSSGSDPGASPGGNSKWVSTRVEAELTQSKPSKTMGFVDTTFTGWSIGRKGVLKILTKLEDKVKGFGQMIIDRTTFEQMDALKLYEIKGSIIVYEKGFLRLRQAFIDDRSETKIVEKLVETVGNQEMTRWCRWIKQNSGNSGIERYYGEEREYSCLQPWMKEILSLRKERTKKRDGRGELAYEAKILDLVQKNIASEKWLGLVGEDGFFFVVRVGGFRTNDELGYENYISNSVGTYDNQEGLGVFSEFSNKYGIMGYELNAQYFSEGF